jgi:hypothetical protein
MQLACKGCRRRECAQYTPGIKRRVREGQEAALARLGLCVARSLIHPQGSICDRIRKLPWQVAWGGA